MEYRYIIGQRGVGKTSLLNELIQRDTNRAVCVFDTSGALINSVQYDTLLDPTISRWNPFAEPIDRNLAPNLFADTAVDLLRHRGSDRPLWLINLRLNAQFIASAFIDCKRKIEHIPEFLLDPSFRDGMNILDAGTRQYWDFVDAMQRRERTGHISSLYSQFSSLLMDARTRHLFSTSAAKLSLAADNGVLLVHLPLSQYSAETVSFVGTMVLNYLSELSPHPCSFYIDNLELFGSAAITKLLENSPHPATMAHQYISQLDEKVFQAIQGNCAKQFIFRVSKQDAEVLSADFPPMSSKSELDRLARFTYRSLPYDKYAPDGVTIPLERG